MSTLDISLKPNPKQELALTTRTQRLILTGGQRGGKTLAALLKIREIAVRMPGSQILIMRKSLKEIRDDIWKHLYNPTDGLFASSKIYGKLNKSNYEHQFPNGSKILYRQGGDSGDEKKLLGMDLSVVYFEQAENISKHMFEFALGRLTHWGDNKNPESRGYRYIQKYGKGEYASSIAKKPAHFFIMSCNPDTSSWIYDDIIRTVKTYDETSKTWKGFNHLTPLIHHQDLGWDIVNFQTYDNQIIPSVAKYIAEQKQMTSDTFYRRMIEGEWVGNDGLIYSHFSSEKHLIKDAETPENGIELSDTNRYEIIIAIDPGSAWYTGVVFGAYDKKHETYIIWDEIKVRDTIIPDIAEQIKEKLKAYRIDINNAVFLIDAAANANESSGISKSDQYKQCGIYVVNANKTLTGSTGGAIVGLERINGLFKQNRIVICGNCIHLINDIKSYMYDEDGKPNKRTGSQAFDMCDAFRYILNKYAYGLEFKENKVIIPKNLSQEEIRLAELTTMIFNKDRGGKFNNRNKDRIF